MTKSVSTTVVEVMNNINYSYNVSCQSQPHDSLT